MFGTEHQKLRNQPVVFGTFEQRVADALSRADQEVARWKFITGATLAELFDKTGEFPPVQQHVPICNVVRINRLTKLT